MTARLLRSARHNRPTLLALLLAGISLAGCQSATPQLSDDYPPEYAAGFGDGCASGRQAGGALTQFRKDVPRYLGQPLYAEGWNDGYRQCEALLQARSGLDERRGNALERQRDREWRHHVDQAKAQALHR